MRLDTLRGEPFASAAEHMAAEFRWLDARLREYLRRLDDQGRFDESELRGLRLEERHVLAGLSPSRTRKEPPRDQLRAIIDERALAGEIPPLYRIADTFGLDDFERAALVIAAAPSLDTRFRTAIALAQNDATRHAASPNLIIDMIDPDGRFDLLPSFTPDAPLMRHMLISVTSSSTDRPLADKPLSVDDRIVMALLGQHSGRLPELEQALEALDPREEDWAPDLIEVTLDDRPVIVFENTRDSGQGAVAARRAADNGMTLLSLDIARLATDSIGHAIALAAREARLINALLYIEAAELDRHSAAVPAIVRLVATDESFVLSATPEVAYIAEQVNPARVQRIDLPLLDAVDRLKWWQAASPDPDDPRISRIAWRSRLGPTGIGKTRGRNISDASPVGRPLPAMLRPVRSRWTRDDLVVSDLLARQIDELTAFVSNWPKVLGDWGFGESNPQSRHCLALFSGPSGTGKSMTAGIVARAAGVPLYRTSLASIFDKYLGETEKQIDRLFQSAADAGIAILCDEADALFGSRTESTATDSHSKYSNLTVSHLLQRVEEHEGLVILTSNLPRNMDDALVRRIAHSLPFTLPDEAGRLELWTRAIPACADVRDDINLPAIAETFELSGGDIRNAALAAAYLAADDEKPIGMPHLLRAIERELAKIGRTPIADDFGCLYAER